MNRNENTPDERRLSESYSFSDSQWTIAQALLTANAQTTQALEYLLLATYREDGSLNLDAMQAGIQQAQNEHQQILEELQLAEQAIIELQQDHTASPQS